jgi:predicted O-methyltransferase YrrM
VSNKSIVLTDDLQQYMVDVGVREAPILARLREETSTLPMHQMQIAPEQGAFMALLVELMDAKRCLELGTFTGYSSLAVAMALPPDGRIVCCDISREWTDIARRYWREAGVDDRVDLRLGPALETLDAMLAAGEANSYDFAFIDARKEEYDDYYERTLRLLRPGGLMAIDNMFQGGDVVDASDGSSDTVAVRALNEKIRRDARVSISLVPIADGLMLARKRG